MRATMITVAFAILAPSSGLAVPVYGRDRNINVVQNLFGNSTAVNLIGTEGDIQVLNLVFPGAKVHQAFDFACKIDEDTAIAQEKSAAVAAAARALCLCLNGPDDAGANSVKTCFRQNDEALIAAGVA